MAKYQFINFFSNQVLYETNEYIKDFKVFLSEKLPIYLNSCISIMEVQELECKNKKIIVHTLYDELIQMYTYNSNKFLMQKYNESIFNQVLKKYKNLTIEDYNTTLNFALNLLNPKIDINIRLKDHNNTEISYSKMEITKNNVKITDCEKDLAILHLNELQLFGIKTDFNVHQSVLQKIQYHNKNLYVSSYPDLLNNIKKLLNSFVNDYKIYEKAMEIVTYNNIKILIHTTKKLSIDIFNVTLQNYHTLMTALNAILFNCLKYQEIKEHTNTKDCQKTRQPKFELGFLKQSSEHHLQIGGNKTLKCEDPNYKYPGFTKKGTPCCFKIPTENKFSLLGITGKFEPCEPMQITKETLTNKLKKNVYVIDLIENECLNSDYQYDIYDTSKIYAFHSETNQWWECNKITETKLEYKTPSYTGIKYAKEYVTNKKLKPFIKSQIIDQFENTIYLEINDGLVPVVPQPKILGLQVKHLHFVESQLQCKLLDLFKIPYEIISKDFIRIKNLGIYIPTSAYGQMELVSLEKQLRHFTILT